MAKKKKTGLNFNYFRRATKLDLDDTSTLTKTELLTLAHLFFGRPYNPQVSFEDLWAVVVEGEEAPTWEETPFNQYRQGLSTLIEDYWGHVYPSLPMDCQPQKNCWDHSDGKVAHCLEENLVHLLHLKPEEPPMAPSEESNEV